MMFPNETSTSSLGENVTEHLATDEQLPIDMRFNEGHVVSIATYSVLMAVSACGNITVLANLLKRRHRTNPRVTLMLIHLAIADLLVTLVLMPLEIGWAATVQWKAGDTACRFLSFFRTFGLFLSSFVLICISIDRFGAILQPLNMSNWKRRGRLMLTTAWLASGLCSLPQMFIFHVEKHPNFPWYEQCVSFNTFTSRTHEMIYVLISMVLMYALPLCIFIFTYGSIIYEIAQRSRQEKKTNEDGIRRLTGSTLGKARIKTVKMTVTIVGVFVVCWTPYYVMTIWYWCDSETFLQVDQRIQKGLFLFAVTNSCVNPIVYGIFSRRRTRKAHELQRKIPYHGTQPCKLARSPKDGTTQFTKVEDSCDAVEMASHARKGAFHTAVNKSNNILTDIL